MTEDGPHAVDIHVGQRIRARRKELSVSQLALAEALGLTFQQVQKYERGSNRVSASKLWQAARTLRVPISYFYEGLPDDLATEAPVETAQREFANSLLGIRLVNAAIGAPAELVQVHVIALETAKECLAVERAGLLEGA